MDLIHHDQLNERDALCLFPFKDPVVEMAEVQDPCRKKSFHHLFFIILIPLLNLINDQKHCLP